MKKRFISTCILGVLLAMICTIFLFKDREQPLASKKTLTNDAKTKPLTKSLPSKNESRAHPEATLISKPKMKIANQLVAGGRQWKLNFADQSLPEEVRQRIGYDLNLIFGHLPETVIDTLPFSIEIDGKQLDRRVRFEGNGRKWNNVLQSESFGCLFKEVNLEELYVPKDVITAYNKAIDIEKSNQEAYQQLDQFLERMTEIKERPIENVRELFVVADDFKSAEVDLAAIPAAGFADAWGGKLYREPSILDVKETVGTQFEKYGSLVATTYAMSKGKVDDLPPLVYSNGQWKFLLQRPPT